MTNAGLLGLLLWLGCLAVTIAAWPARRLPTKPRRLVLVPIFAATFLSPIAMPPEPLWLKALAALTWPLCAMRLIDLHVGAAYWRERRLADWIRYLLNQFVLVPRVSVGRHTTDAPFSRGRLVRAIVQIVLGIALGWWSLRHDWTGWPFLVEHGVKLIAVYLAVFDGMFLLAQEILRFRGTPVLSLTRDPILATTPADFWRRYNCEAGRFLREDIYKPAGGLRRPARGILAVFVFNGCLHEYLAWLLTGRIMGLQLAFFALNGLAVAGTHQLRPEGAWKWIGRGATLTFMAATSILFFESVRPVLQWYQR